MPDFVKGYGDLRTVAQKYHRSRCAEDNHGLLEQIQLPMWNARRPELRNIEHWPGLIETEFADKEIEGAFNPLGIASAAAHAAAEPRIVELAFARAANERLHACRSVRTMLLQPGHEDRRNGPWQAEQHETGASRAGVFRGFEDRGNLLIGKTRNEGSEHRPYRHAGHR